MCIYIYTLYNLSSVSVLGKEKYFFLHFNYYIQLHTCKELYKEKHQKIIKR